MFRHIVAFLLVSFYAKSSGAPTNGSSTDLYNLLINLASTCENQFLIAQITSKLNDCHVLVPPYDEKKIQCMLFYDINKQLCAAVGASKIALNNDYSETIKKEQDIAKVCTAAKEWRFTELGEIYKKYVSVVFSNSIRCARVCSADNDDILNVESNFYCKYFKWGAEVLKTLVKIVPTQSGTAVGAPVNLPSNTDTATKKPAPSPVGASAQSGLDVNAKNPVVVLKPLAAADTDAAQVASADPALSTSEKANSKPTQHVEIDPALSIPEVLPNNGVGPTPNSDKTETSINKGAVDSNSVLSGKGTSNDPVEEIKPEKKQETLVDDSKNRHKPKANEPDADNKKEDQANNLPNNQVEKSNLNDNADTDDYQNELEADEVKGGISDNQGGDDGDDGSLGDIELKAEKNKIDDNKKSDPSLTQININDISQKEYYPSDGFSEDDDHFFSFFLTAIIMVVLLYVLYHNKSKVSKVIMGLIVEGRQPGRRRNSRGHAYKRLDTLEQAMSTNSAAPPSKIIY